MSGLVRSRRGRLSYTGRFAKADFLEWAETPAGRAEIAGLSSSIFFSFMGKSRAARRRLWRDLADAASDRDVVSIAQREIDAYIARIGELAYADGLPRVGIELHRLVVVPRALINGAAYTSIATTLIAHPAFTAVEGTGALRDFFILTLIRDIDAAVVSAGPSPVRPVATGKDWVTVGLNPSFVWRLPLLDEPAWDGHHYVLEQTREPMTRAGRKRLTAEIARLEGSLPSLSRLERTEIMRRATVHRKAHTA